MNTNALKAVVWICLANALCGSVAQADLGTCLVFRNGAEELDGEAYDGCAQSIYDAYSHANVSDQDFIFVLAIDSSRSAAYSIARTRLAYGDEPRPGVNPWPGYQITAPNIEGLRLGVAEIVKAFQTDVIYRLKSAERDGPVETPLLRD